MSCVFFVTYSQEDDRRQRQDGQHVCVSCCAPVDRRRRFLLWEEERVEGGEKRSRVEWMDGRPEDNRRTTTERPLSTRLYPTTPLRQEPPGPSVRSGPPPPPPPFTPLRGHRWNWSELQRHQRQWLKLTHVQNNFNKWIVQLFWSNSPVKTRTRRRRRRRLFQTRKN